MKPRYRVYCYDCQRTKMLFETESKANNFIRYNADDIEKETGRRPCRSYYCHACCGWHITSKPTAFHGRTHIDKIFDHEKEFSEQRKEIRAEYKRQICEQRKEIASVVDALPEELSQIKGMQTQEYTVEKIDFFLEKITDINLHKWLSKRQTEMVNCLETEAKNIRKQYNSVESSA